ncbi:contractile injection system tape measure protein [Draconibacterium sp. IB214405]|uniref:contractile injection system tape measure protein n=1 Tax=Draconibacterium sp. IB214405 TaxID=3097352 RepID=UPI002A13854F|nr:contractile injection system tape measure protein [Draconibacterium sp. IB214405]MDX8339929.1 contractile injection system tape measure protein [Draconibacterium sp. IB214405]
MYSEKKHIIEKVFLEVNMPNEKEALRIQNNVGVYAQEKLIPILEELFDEYDKGTDIIRFDRLDIDFSVQDWEDEVSLKFYLTEKLKAQLGRGVNGNFQKPETKEKNDSDDEEKQIVDQQQNHHATFLFFIEKGYLPWFGKQEYISELTAENNWKENLANANFLTELKKLAQNRTSAIKRLVLQFSDEVIVDFLAALNEVKIKEKSKLLNFLLSSETEFRNTFLEGLIMLSVKVCSEKEFIVKILELLYIRRNQQTINRSAITDKIKSMNDSLRTCFLQDSVFRYFDEEEVEAAVAELIENKIEIKSGKGPNKLANSIQDQKPTIENDEFVSKEKQSPFFDKGNQNILVKNAGLVILGPFLPAFLNQFNWISENGKIKNNAKIEVVQAIHYCATGNEQFFEGDLVLEKFLSGVPLQTTLPVASLLNDNIKKEANNMLSEVIKNWPALKNTGADGLRQLFLDRNGKLTKTEHGFKLIVERKAQDILLDKIPWNISLLKLPWREELLFIEW